MGASRDMVVVLMGVAQRYCADWCDGSSHTPYCQQNIETLKRLVTEQAFRCQNPDSEQAFSSQEVNR